jgi:hypothetical protein
LTFVGTGHDSTFFCLFWIGSYSCLRYYMSQINNILTNRFSKKFILDTDASNETIGAVLSQEIDRKERPIAFASRTLTKPERRYCITRKELLAVVFFVKHFKHYLYGNQFIVRTDHGSLRWLLNFKNPEGQLARWLRVLNSYDMFLCFSFLYVSSMLCPIFCVFPI